MTVLDRAALEAKLAEFEAWHALLAGAELSSPAFYERYLDGDVDEIPSALEWATYYELWLIETAPLDCRVGWWG